MPLADARGAQTVVLQLRTERACSVAVKIGPQTLQLAGTAAYRSYSLFAPAVSSPRLTISLTGRMGNAVLVDEVSVTGRPGIPPIVDFLALLLLATIPALLMLLTARLPFDWALLPSLVVLILLTVLPAADRRALLNFGPLAALVVCAVASSAPLRARPTFALILLLAAALRWYALGWGGGYAFHPEEQALLAGHSSSVFTLLIRGTALTAGWISGNPGWSTGWGLVLIGRAWSALLGTALIVAVYVLAVHLLRPRWALLATAFVACTPGLVQQSHVAGEVQWIVLSVVVLVLLSTRILFAPQPWTIAATFGVAAGIIYGVPAGVVWLVAPAVAHLATRRRHPEYVVRSAMLLALLAAGILRWTSETVALTAET